MKQLEDKLKYLDKLLKVYIKFFKHFRKVKVEHSDKIFIVTYYDRTGNGASYKFKSEEIPIEDIDKYTLSIKSKVDREFVKRRSNKYLNK